MNYVLSVLAGVVVGIILCIVRIVSLKRNK